MPPIIHIMGKYDKIFKNDKLSIQSDVVDFAHLIEQEGGEAKVYSISAEFGIGKTFFCDRLQEVLTLDGIPVAKMNIWEMDFYEDPLIPILIKIQEVYKKHHKFSTAAKWTWKRIINFPRALFSATTATASQAGCGARFDFDKFIKTYKNLNQKTEIYGEYKKYEKELKLLKGFLQSWAKETKKPIIIIIDEMDRCRPDYAVKTLEVLKHFFDIQGFVFVLALDEKQLETSVKCLFGTENFDGYKRKFINNSFLLPAPDKIKFVDFLYEKTGIAKTIGKIQKDNRDLVFKIKIDGYGNFVHQNFGVGQSQGDVKELTRFNDMQTPESIIKRYFAAYSIWFKFSLRQMEQVFDRLVLFAKEIANSNELFSPDLAVLLVCLHEFDVKIYADLRKSNNHHIYGINPGIINKIYCGSQITSCAYQVYKEKSFEMFDGNFNRTLVPKIPLVARYSGTIEPYRDSKTTVIHDNVDRFFIPDPKAEPPLKWLIEIQDSDNGIYSSIDNNGRIAQITKSKHNAQWETLEPDIDTASTFDLDQFRLTYFSKMDFISKFKSAEPAKSSEPTTTTHE